MLLECRIENILKEILIKKKLRLLASVTWNLKLGMLWARRVFSDRLLNIKFMNIEVIQQKVFSEDLAEF